MNEHVDNGAGALQDEEDLELLETVAFTFIANAVQARKISKADADFLKAKYKNLYGISRSLKSKDKALDKKNRILGKEILADKIYIEKLRGAEIEDANEIKKLEKQREHALKDFDYSEQTEARTKYELAELKKQHEEISLLIENQKKSNQEIIEPVFEALNKEIAKIEVELERCDLSLEKEYSQKAIMQKKLQETDELRRRRNEEFDHLAEEAAAASLEPSRLSRTGASMEKAVKHMTTDLEVLQKRITQRNLDIEKQAYKREEANKLKKSLETKLETHHRTIDEREIEVSALRQTFENEKYKHHDLITRKVDLNVRKKEIDSELRHRKDQLVLAQKEYDSLKRFYKKKKTALDAEAKLLPAYDMQLKEEEIRIEFQKDQLERKKVNIGNLKDELDGFVGRLVSQEDAEESTKEELDRLLATVDDMEAEILHLIAEEKRTIKLATVLASHRDIKAREGTRVTHKEKETRQHVIMKELIVLDLTKRCNEISNRLKEFSALYEVVKNERNKYVNLIQSSSQALAEMREKIRILSSEVDILRTESQAKDSTYVKERSSHTQAQSQRDALRQEMNKLLAEYRHKQSVVEQQIQQIDKLNLVINKLEQEMIGLKTRNEKLIDERNAIGVQLIDRNDELCILYERSKQQQEILNTGETKLLQKEDDLRTLRLQMEELQRQYRAAITHVPEVEELRQRLKRIEAELVEERKVSEQLGVQMEDPDNTERWRAIEGEDPGIETLATKIKILEEMLDRKRSQQLDKGLVLEEVVSLTEKLRNQALSRRDTAKAMADQLNDLQTRIRDVTKKMLVSVSELSMYQATALRLQQEKIRREKDLEEARWRIDHGEAPNEEAVRDLSRSQRLQTQRRIQSAQREEELEMEKKELMIKTTAEPRPTAYIPDEIGIPKPYGVSAPFKPSELGSSMRHIRPPQPKPIEI